MLLSLSVGLKQLWTTAPLLASRAPYPNPSPTPAYVWAPPGACGTLSPALKRRRIALRRRYLLARLCQAPYPHVPLRRWPLPPLLLSKSPRSAASLSAGNAAPPLVCSWLSQRSAGATAMRYAAPESCPSLKSTPAPTIVNPAQSSPFATHSDVKPHAPGGTNQSPRLG